jgi:replication fork protection complex subunit Csm3/Swi3
MLNMYQLWLDDLYPRAKFADALAIIEKVGHTKRMQMMRKDWIDEGKPRRSRQDDEEDLPEDVPTEANTEEGANAMEGLEGHLNNEEAEHVPEREEHMRDQPNQISKPTTGDNPDDDELDALLAESLQPEIPTSKTLPVRTAADADPFADEMEAMADMDDMW